jgi:hypothetical protein
MCTHPTPTDRYFREAPHVGSDAGSHRRRGRVAVAGLRQRGVRPCEVVVHVVQRDRVRQVLDLLGEAVREPGEAAHPHAHGEVLTLHVGRGRLVDVRVAGDGADAGW